MKLALILNAVNPAIGGVLIRGEKGTAKSTLVRGLTGLMPEITVVEGCRYGCDPENRERLCSGCKEKIERGEVLGYTSRKTMVVDLPINATQDRVAGTIDIEHAIRKGEKRFEPGILAEANRSILYVDEVNLLGDHIVDILLDSAAMGVNVVEREGISCSHPAHFILVGTMNPEEGEIRPQLLDRFGLCVDVEGIKDIGPRIELTKRRMAYEKDPRAFVAAWEPEQQKARERILAARKLLPEIVVPEPVYELIAATAMNLGVDGHRSDIVMIKAARTNAAFNGRSTVTKEDIEEVADLVYSHRMRKRPFEDVADKKRIVEAIGKKDFRIQR
jgi:Mg-chelatase subunit ChlI